MQINIVAPHKSPITIYVESGGSHVKDNFAEKIVKNTENWVILYPYTKISFGLGKLYGFLPLICKAI